MLLVSCDWAVVGNAELRWPSPVPEVRLRQAGGGSLSSSEARDGAAFEHEVAQLIGAAMKELRVAHFQW